MKNGDLSNQVAPRILIVFEGAVGYLPPDKVDAFLKHEKKSEWRKAIACFDLNWDILGQVLRITRTKNYNVSVVTWLPQEAADAVEEILIENNIPVRSVLSSSPEALAKMLPYNPDVVTVYDPVPEHVLTFGSKGYVLTRPSQIGS